MMNYRLSVLIPLILVINLTLKGQGIIGTIYQPGLSPTGISIYESGNKIFVADTSDKIFMYDGATFELLDTIHTTLKGINEMVMMENAGKLYATVFDISTTYIAVIDANSGNLNQLLYTGWGSWLIQLRKDEELGRVYALCRLVFYQIDAETDEMTIIPEIDGTLLSNIEINPVTHEMFYKWGMGSPLTVINAFSYDFFEVTDIGYGFGIGVNWIENKVYIAYTGGGPSYIYNRDTGEVTETSTSNDATVLVFNPTGNRMYSSSEVDGWITIIEGATDSSFNIPLEGNYKPYVCYATSHIFYSAKFLGYKVWFIDDYSLASNIIDAEGEIIGINQLTKQIYVAGDDSIKIFQDHLWSLASPTLVSPLNGTGEVPLNTVIRWNSVPGATSYNAQVDTWENFVYPDVDETNIMDTKLSIHLDFSNVIYYWHVSANDEYGTSMWSETWEFKTTSPYGINDLCSEIQYRIFPNPVSSQTMIYITLKESSDIRLEVLNNMGQIVAVMDKSLPQGEQQVIWNAEGLPMGLYFYRLTVDKQRTANGKLIVIK